MIKRDAKEEKKGRDYLGIEAAVEYSRSAADVQEAYSRGEVVL